MSRRIYLMFEHPTCQGIVVDIHLPLPDPAEKSTDDLALRVRPACPICKQPMRYSGWGFSDTDDGKAEPEKPQ